jgi:hypothetical protein
MEKKVSAAVEKLNKSLLAIAESMTQLQLDIEKVSARIGAIDTELALISRHLRRDGNGNRSEDTGRDLALEREVFGQMTTRPMMREAGRRSAGKSPQKGTKSKPSKKAAKPGAKRRR